MHGVPAAAASSIVCPPAVTTRSAARSGSRSDSGASSVSTPARHLDRCVRAAHERHSRVGQSRGKRSAQARPPSASNCPLPVVTSTRSHVSVEPARGEAPEARAQRGVGEPARAPSRGAGPSAVPRSRRAPRHRGGPPWSCMTHAIGSAKQPPRSSSGVEPVAVDDEDVDRRDRQVRVVAEAPHDAVAVMGVLVRRARSSGSAMPRQRSATAIADERLMWPRPASSPASATKTTGLDTAQILSQRPAIGRVRPRDALT